MSFGYGFKPAMKRAFFCLKHYPEMEKQQYIALQNDRDDYKVHNADAVKINPFQWTARGH
jgi:hypothetical protein